MSDHKDKDMEIEALSDDDLESVSGGYSYTGGGGTCNTSSGICDTEVGSTCKTTGGECNNVEQDISVGGGSAS
jgi:hypothetical protein